MTSETFFEALSKGERHFNNLEFEYLDGFQNTDFSDCIFESCFLYIDFHGSNFTNAKFIQCNLKEIKLVNCNLTNAVMKNCLVESAEFAGSTIDGFEFSENYYFGTVVGQEDFKKSFML